MKIKYALLIAVLITVSILPTTNLCAHKEKANQRGADSCSQGVCPCSQHPIMHPDSQTLHEWLECYNRAPCTYIDPMLEPPTGSISLLSHLEYDPVERDQGSCGNCWAWAGTGVLEIALDVQEGILDRLSMQYLNSKYNGGTGSNWACCGGWLEDLADFYASEGFAIPWSNTNAAWADGTQSCAESTSVPWETISTSPNYPITNCTAESITTTGVGQTTAISNIKNVLAQGKAIWFGYFLPTGADWDEFFYFWNYQSEDVIWNPDYSCGHTWDSGGGGHAVLCVGYNDDDPENAYWIMVNSWGTAYGGRPNGIFHVDMNMNYDCYFYDWPFTYYSFYWQTLDVTFNIETAEQADTYLVIRDMDNHIYYSIYNSSSETWGSWLALPGATCDSPAAAVCQDELHIVVRGVTGDLWHGYVNATDSTFSGWTQLSGSTPSAPTLTASATSLYLVVRGNDDKIYYRCWTGSWSGWTALPGATANRTAATVLGDNLHVIVNGLDGNMYHGYVNITTSTFSGWTLLPGATPSPPELAASATKLYLGVRGMNDKIYYNSWDGASWLGWTALPGATMDSPAATVLENNLHLVVRGIDGNMYHGYLDLADGWSGWTKLSGATPSAPELASAPALGPPEVVKWVVIVGISDYKAIDDLSYCDEDATDWYNHLSGAMDYDYIWVYGDGHSGNYPQYDGYATEYNVKQALQNVVNQADSDDIIVFTTSGHGSGNGLGSSCLCMWDCGSGESGEDGDLWDTELANILDDAVASRVFVFIDHCYAGGFGDDLMSMGNSDHVYVTTTCTENGFGYDDSSHQNGAWTYYFLEYTWINHFGADPDMSMEDVFDYAHDHYPYGGGDEPQEYDGDSANPFYLT